jgi:hypothetical protein
LIHFLLTWDHSLKGPRHPHGVIAQRGSRAKDQSSASASWFLEYPDCKKDSEYEIKGFEAFHVIDFISQDFGADQIQAMPQLNVGHFVQQDCRQFCFGFQNVYEPLGDDDIASRQGIGVLTGEALINTR